MDILVYTLLSLIIAYNINTSLPIYVTPRFTGKAGNIAAFASLFVLCLFPVIPRFFPSLLLFGVLYAVYLAIFYKDNWPKLSATSTIFFSIMGSWSYLSSYILTPLRLAKETKPVEVALLVLLVCLHLTYFTVFREYSLAEKEAAELLNLFSPPLWRAISLIALCPALVIFLLVLNPPQNPVLSLLANFLAIGAASLMLPLLLLAANGLRLAEENTKLKENAEYYQEIEFQQTQLRKFKHDLMNQFTVIATYLDLGENEKATEYFKELGAQYSKITTNYTKNSLVNAVLNSKQQKANAQGLKLDIYVDIPETADFNPTDLCTMLANALDNAIEADPPDKMISMTMMTEGSNIVFTCVNRYTGKLKESRTGGFITSKQDKLSHGLGVRNIKEAVKRMGGSVTITTTDQTFTLTAILPNESQ